MATNPYQRADDTVAAKAAVAITPNDSTNLPRVPCRSIYVGAGGDVKVDMVGGGTVTFTSVLAGTILPIQAVRVYATGSTASAMLALY